MQCIQRFSNPTGSQSFIEYVCWMLFLLVVMTSLLGSNSAFSADSSFEPLNPPNSSVGSCPAKHKMYYIGANAPTSTLEFPVTSLKLEWDAGRPKKIFTFSDSLGDKTFTINFPTLLDLNNNNGGTPPFYGSVNGATISALNLVHNSPGVRTNHVLNVSINRTVSKVGYKIQDLDSSSSGGQVAYIEQVDVSANRGQLTFNSSFHTRNTAGNVVTARSGINCPAGGCTIDTSWGYNIPNTELKLEHNNSFTQTNSPHAVGYSDFYFCLAPPKLIVRKQLNDIRVNDNDQFEIKVTGGTVANSFTTTGTGKTINNGSSNVISLAESTSYKITESVVNGTIGDMAHYNATYTCSNATTGSTTTMPTAAMEYDIAAKTRSFTLANATYGDEITCTIINTPKDFTFSGTVFNDNGGILASPDTRYDTDKFIATSNYFNGKFDSNELGISGITYPNLKVSLTDCSGTLISTTSVNPQPVSTLGQYSFSVMPITLKDKTKVCLVQIEPDNWEYTVDTTADKREVALATTRTYENLDFGEVKTDNASLVLIKSQYIHTCNKNLIFTSISDTLDPTIGFSTKSPTNKIEIGKCIAYKIVAYNRGHLDLNNIQITDELQINPVKSIFQLPLPLSNPANINRNIDSLPNGKIISNTFDLVAVPLSINTPKATLYFNTKYGTTVDP